MTTCTRRMRNSTLRIFTAVSNRSCDSWKNWPHKSRINAKFRPWTDDKCAHLPAFRADVSIRTSEYLRRISTMSDDRNGNIGWFIAGLGLGALIGVLYAPKSG